MSIKTDLFASYKLLGQALEARGYRKEFNKDRPATITFTSPKGVSWKTHAAHIAYPFNTEAIRDISIHKEKAYAFADAHGFSVPFTHVIEDGIAEDEANAFFAQYKKLIVKPADSSLSNGLTLNITNYTTLLQAIKKAHEYSSKVLLQQQVEGEEIRFTVINGNVEVALLRRTARIIGDGVHTVSELIAKENDERSKLTLPYITYPLLTSELIDESFFHDNSIPKKDEAIELNRSTMIKKGCSVYNILASVHPSYIKKIETLVADLHAGFMVVDVFCQDYKKPLNQNYWLIEFNTAPALKLYYSCRDGNQYDIVSRLAVMIDRSLQG